jgi:mannose-6-phosphate isomerase
VATTLYPLRFRPIFRQYIWGGRRLETVLGKTIGPGDHFAESWEICDHGPDQSVVQSGPLAGTTLGEVVSQNGAALFGRHHPQPRFPLLLKFLDAAQTLSVQVHPDDARAARLDPPDLGKTEAWVILAAEPGSKVYAGLEPAVDRARLADAVRQGTCEACLHSFEGKPGDCVFLPAGTVHALGQGLLVAEIQQASNVTYRLFDWNRLGADGQPRPLHVEQALGAIDYGRGPVGPQQPRPTGRQGVSRLVEGEKFILDRWQFESPQAAGGDQRCHIIAILEGAISVQGDPSGEMLARGQTVLLPAVLGEVRLRPHGRTVLLDAYLP